MSNATILAMAVSVSVLTSCSAPASTVPEPNKLNLQAVAYDSTLFSLGNSWTHQFGGQWNLKADGAGVNHYVPTGDGDHYVAFIGANGSNYLFGVESGGECYVLPAGPDSTSVFVAKQTPGQLQLGGASFMDSGDVGAVVAPCDGVYSGVTNTTWDSSACWGPLSYDPKTGVYSRTCSNSNGQGCKATLQFSDGSTLTANFRCESSGGASGNSSASGQHAAVSGSVNCT